MYVERLSMSAHITAPPPWSARLPAAAFRLPPAPARNGPAVKPEDQRRQETSSSASSDSSIRALWARGGRTRPGRGLAPVQLVRVEVEDGALDGAAASSAVRWILGGAVLAAWVSFQLKIRDAVTDVIFWRVDDVRLIVQVHFQCKLLDMFVMSCTSD